LVFGLISGEFGFIGSWFAACIVRIMTYKQSADAGDPQTYGIIGASMDVHTELGCGFHERVYREPFALELAARHVPFEREVKFPIRYKGRIMPVAYRVDFICYREILVELKALQTIGPTEEAQVINYLRASNLKRALVINFGGRSLQFKRLVWGYGGEALCR
jgi:GxxExxY protein